MARGKRFACAGLIATVVSMLTAFPARAATSVDVVSAIRMEGGAAVQVAATVACDPFSGDSFAALALTLFQGTPNQPDYLEGFGGVGNAGVDGLTCDNAAHTYSFTVRPTAPYADKTFRLGPAGTEWVVQVCTKVAPGETECTNVAGPVQQAVLIVQNPLLVVHAALTSERPNPHRATAGDRVVVSGSIGNTTAQTKHVSVSLTLVPPSKKVLTIPFRIVLGPHETAERSFSFVVSGNEPTGRYRLKIVAITSGRTSRASARLVIF